MKQFDESLLKIEFEGSPYLGETITAKFTVDDSNAMLYYKSSRRDIENRTSMEVEWIIVEPGSNNMIKIIKGNSLKLDESTFEKRISVHSTPKVDKMDYIGMPFRQEFPIIELCPRKLSQFIHTHSESSSKSKMDEVTKIYAYFAGSMINYNREISKSYSFEFNTDNTAFWYVCYRNKIELENNKKKLKYNVEEKNFLQNKCEKQSKEMEKIKAEIEKKDRQIEAIKVENEFLLEEKNLFMSSSHFRNTQESSFLEEKSNSLGQSNILNFTAVGMLPNIPAIANQTFDFNLMEEMNPSQDLISEKTDLEEKLKSYERQLENYKKEIVLYKDIYAENKIKQIANENKRLKITVTGQKNYINECENKLKNYDFAYKYLSKEFEEAKRFSKIFSGKGNDENFLMASNIIQNLTKEMYEKNKMIEELEKKIDTLKSELSHNQTF